MLESIAQDVRFATRALARSRGVTATAVLTLAVGVAATAVIFSIVYALLVSPLPYRDIDRSVVVTLRGVTDVGGWKGRTSFSSSEFAAFRAGNHVLDDVMGGRTLTVLYEDAGSTRIFRGAQVTSNAFDFLGIPPRLGRSFTGADGRPGAAVPQAFLPYSVQGFSWRTFLARTSVVPESLQRSVRDAIWAIDPRIGVSAAGSIEGSLRDFYRDPRFDQRSRCSFRRIVPADDGGRDPDRIQPDRLASFGPLPERVEHDDP